MSAADYRSIPLGPSEKTAAILHAAHQALAAGHEIRRCLCQLDSLIQPGDLLLAAPAAALFPVESLPLPAALPGAGKTVPLSPHPVALLWDKSFLWGYVALKSMATLGFPLHLLTGREVQEGQLCRYGLVVVPGGWAVHKRSALGRRGCEQLQRFVRRGGSYLGICGGAGLALQVEEGLGLLPVARKPISARLPNFSGGIQVKKTLDHPLWWSLGAEEVLQVWWPSQFMLLQPEAVRVVGRYGRPAADFCVSDLDVQQTEASGVSWSALEEAYAINLDPDLLENEPAIIAGDYGAGRVVLSYPHLETPDDPAGNLALFNLWHSLSGTPVAAAGPELAPALGPVVDLGATRQLIFKRWAAMAEELIVRGERQQLWSWRNSWLLRWRRGVRGAEFGSLCVLLRALVSESAVAPIWEQPPGGMALDDCVGRLERCWQEFYAHGSALLDLGPDVAGQPETKKLLRRLFGTDNCYGSKTYGGLYREVLDLTDILLLGMLRPRYRPEGF